MAREAGDGAGVDIDTLTDGDPARGTCLTAPRTSPGGWEAFKVGVELPWCPPAPRVFTEPVVGDHLVRIAYQLAQRIVHGKVATVRREPRKAGQRCPVPRFAKDSLLHQSQQELRKDVAVNDLFVAVGRTEPY
jgi:hypothetical protein